MTKDLPEVESQAVIHDEETGIHEDSSVTASGHSRLEDSNITNSGISDHGVITRSKKRMLANSARGKFRGESRKVSQVIPHSHNRDTGEMGSSSCFSVPLLCLGVYSILATLVIAVLSFFLHQSSGRPSRTVLSGAADGEIGCVETGPQYSTTNLDFMNVDISSKKIMDSAQSVKCDCNWETILEWGIFEVVSVVLLVCIFCWLCLGDGLSHCNSFLKKRNSDMKRLEREYELTVKKQERLAQKMGKACPETGSAHASTVEEKQPFSAV